MDEFVSVKLWDIFSTIQRDANLQKKLTLTPFFIDSMIVLIECDLRLPAKVLYYFEDVITDFKRVILTANDMFYSYEYYIKVIVVEERFYWKNTYIIVHLGINQIKKWKN